MNSRLKYIIIAFTAVSFLLVAAKSFYYTEKFGGVDLRHHIIASRLLSTAQSPYFYKPQLSDGDYFLEGHRSTHFSGNGTTVTPSVLYLFYPLTLLPYKTIRIIWMVLQFIFLAASIFFVVKKRFKQENNFLPFIIVTLGLVCSNFWLMHVERGQVYIFYALLISLSYWCYQSAGKYNQFISGLIIGLLVLIRPLAAIISIPFLVRKKQKWFYGWATGVIAGCLLFVAPRPCLWKDYFNAMQSFANEYTQKDQSPVANPIAYNADTIEGMSNLKLYSLFNAGNMNTFHNYCEMTGLNITLKQSLIVYSIIVLALSFFFFKMKSHSVSAETLFLFGFLLYFLSEVFILAPRAAYCVVEWIPALFIMAKKLQCNKSVMLFIAASILLLHGFPFNFPFQFDIGESLLAGILVYAIFEDLVLEKIQLK